MRPDTQNDAVCRRRNGGHRPRQFASLVFTKQNYTNIGNVDALATKQTRGQRAKLVRFKSHLLIKVKKKNSAIPYGITELLLVAEMGFEPHDLRVMSPASYQTAPLRDILVPEAGVEPVREKISRDFKSRASANSAIPACNDLTFFRIA